MSLTALCPLDGRYAPKLDALRPYLSEYGLIKARVQVEISWFIHLSRQENIAEVPTLTEEAFTFVQKIGEQFSEADAERVKAIEATINHDVKAVEYFIKERFEASGLEELEATKEFIHFGCTSEDINNIAYALMLSDARFFVIQEVLETLYNTLSDFRAATADIPMLSRTHGQPASPTTVGKEIANVLARLHWHITTFNAHDLSGKMNGAVGNYNAHLVAYPDIDWPDLTQAFVESHDLVWNDYTTQIEPHDTTAEYFDNLARVNRILIDLCRDIWGYISLGYFKQKPVSGEVGSSTMPHKINPIDFENAEGNLGVANAILHHLSDKLPTSRWQRDLTDSTVLRNVGVAIGHSVFAFHSIVKGLKKLDVDASRITADLAAHWEVLAEPIQMVMRKHGISAPYEKLKDFTRGKPVNQETLHAFINGLALPPAEKEALLELRPETYLGYAKTLAQDL